MGKKLNFVFLLRCASVSRIQPKLVILGQKSLVLGFVSEISFRLEVWVLGCSVKGQKRIENGMGK